MRHCLFCVKGEENDGAEARSFAESARFIAIYTLSIASLWFIMYNKITDRDPTGNLTTERSDESWNDRNDPHFFAGCASCCP
jgi:hypothetical protein